MTATVNSHASAPTRALTDALFAPANADLRARLQHPRPLPALVDDHNEPVTTRRLRVQPHNLGRVQEALTLLGVPHRVTRLIPGHEAPLLRSGCHDRTCCDQVWLPAMTEIEMPLSGREFHRLLVAIGVQEPGGARWDL